MVKVAPSILSADFSCLGKEIKALEKAGADMIHLDVMDGHFVPNLTFGPVVIKSIRPLTALPFEVHLMVDNPSRLIEPCALAGADIITFHLEVTEDIPALIAQIKKFGKKVGISLMWDTNVSKIIPYLPDIDFILVMSIPGGFSGQKFIVKSIDRIAQLKELIGTKRIEIVVDGGINAWTAPACVLAGADILVAASYIFGQKSYARAIETLKKPAVSKEGK
ncbi:MAG: ribulose-phosphate 3-epimerase [Lactobacillales bacterium]|jgi:ribulose-phosphate 3-epimerase|nr:ribulose-phosphate 3-epimerase [Lactobacillales bacterium]